MPYLTVANGRRLYFEHHASPRRTVVLVHGWGMSGRAWEPTVARLRGAGIGAVTYDQRACGRSDTDFDDFSIEAHGADLAALCAHLSLDAPVLNGWSMGGAVAVDAATRLGPKLGALVLTCGATPRFTRTVDFPFGSSLEDVRATLDALKADRTTLLRNLYFDAVFAAPVDGNVKQRFYEIALEARPIADASLRALADLDQRASLTQIAAPALVVTGGRDTVVSADIGRAAAGALTGAKLVGLDDCGHAPFVENASAYHDALLRFLGALHP